VKPFNVHFRKYGQMSVINLTKSKVLLEFVRCEKKNNNKKKKSKKKKKKSTRTDDNENNKVHFFAKFSNVGEWCRSMREDGKAESGVRLCASKKVAELVFANNCESVLQTRLRYSQKRKHYFIDVVIKAKVHREGRKFFPKIFFAPRGELGPGGGPGDTFKSTGTTL